MFFLYSYKNNSIRSILVRSLQYLILLSQTRQDNSRFFSSINAVPSHAITLGIHDIMQAGQIILIATGANKAEIIAELYDSEVNVNLPASILKTHQRARVFVDQEAAQLLPQEACRFKNS